MQIKVGILSEPKVDIIFKGKYTESRLNDSYSGNVRLFRENGETFLKTEDSVRKVFLPLLFTPTDPATSCFELVGVTIGIDFHWERKENQCFQGSLSLIEENGRLTAIDLLDVEDYLLSVISSEMKATSSAELLKAHAVISRSWLLAQQVKSGELKTKDSAYRSFLQSEDEYIRWYDREDHLNFDVCADDHCQRYQGIQKATTAVVRDAVNSTRGEVLCHEGRICDARFSKCCGGISENFENVWENIPHPYLRSVYDAPAIREKYDLTREEEVIRWIDSSPDVFCHTTDKNILAGVLNEYDLETADFFRWEVCYSQEEISRLIRERLSIDFGIVQELLPVERGASGRLIRLKIVGSRKTMTIGKELVIRKALSRSHLYSSAFIIEKVREKGLIRGFRLRGAGWGHGVGLCQIGAAVMSSRGYSYREILQHYFRDAHIEKLYE